MLTVNPRQHITHSHSIANRENPALITVASEALRITAIMKRLSTVREISAIQYNHKNATLTQKAIILSAQILDRVKARFSSFLQSSLEHDKKSKPF